VSATVLEILGIARDRGFLGPGDVAFHVEHSRAFLPHLPQGAAVADLGSGGGVPGLVIGSERPDLRLTLIDAGARRAEFLEWAVSELGLSIDVICGRAEEVSRQDSSREQFDVVTARAFGAPGVTAECAVGLLRPDGLLVVSEPPDAERSARWPQSGLAKVCLADDGRAEGHESEKGRTHAHFQLLRRVGDLSSDLPRRNGVPAKRPLF
jgi:16S rRNA (guanine527-N7)-methyltransferase